MKISHKVPRQACRPEVITDRYQIEVDVATERLAKAYGKAQRNFRTAEVRLERATAARKSAAKLRLLADAVNARRTALAEIEVLMRASPQSATHRGAKSFRPVPKPGGVL